MPKETLRAAMGPMRRVVSLQATLLAGIAIWSLTSCATGARHQFVNPATDWSARSGQLLYHGPRTSLIGEVLVRFSSAGDFEFTFTKGPGVALLMVRQDANFVRVSGPLARGSWSGAPSNAPVRLRGWIGLRELLINWERKPLVRQSAGVETFTFRF
ncbi:MAG: hypothetical protein ABI871_01720 [Chthoniobacterales bacterium]